MQRPLFEDFAGTRQRDDPHAGGGLVELRELCLPLDASFEFLRDLLILLDGYSVRYRYPGESANKDEAKTAFQTIRQVRAFMRPKVEAWQRDEQ